MKDSVIEKNKPVYFLWQEQYQGLLFCWKIRAGLKKGLDPDRIKQYADWFFKNNLEPHFDIEETFIFPKLKASSQMMKKALADHRRLRRLFTDTVDQVKSLNLLEEELETYFLFERHRLIYEIQNAISDEELKIIMKIHSESLNTEDWGDEFWR